MAIQAMSKSIVVKDEIMKFNDICELKQTNTTGAVDKIQTETNVDNKKLKSCNR